MRWPALNEYREAIQYPDFCFSDSELQKAEVIRDFQGLPAVSSGNYASVYSLKLTTRRVAVRCFNMHVPDHEQRYSEISRALQKSRLPYTVDFRFIPDGILVDGNRYPILLMEWVEGEPLIKYVEKNLSKPEKLADLAKQWFQMSKALQKAGIAHGDLQHGNVIIRNDEIKLIDYDGMYVPALNGWESHERGHRNFQHPSRAGEFCVHLDNFSNWIIYSALVILSIDPSLWFEAESHDECLLFQDSDFKNPDECKTLQRLANKSEHLKSIGARLRAIMKSEFNSIPNLDHTAPLTAEDKLSVDNITELLGANSGGESIEEIRLQADIFRRVWDSRYYRRSNRLMKRAETKLTELTNYLNTLEKVEDQLVAPP